MPAVSLRLAALRETGALARQALRSWTPRQAVLAAAASVGVAIVIGVATVLIPNPLFAREIPPVWWNYPVWLVTSVMMGMLIVTYVRTGPAARVNAAAAEPPRPAPRLAERATSFDNGGDRRTNRLGLTGGVLAWFAVGCPVCNKIALLALGYTGAITWFAPIQPLLALAALALTSAALVWRLRGQAACPAPRATMEPAQ